MTAILTAFTISLYLLIIPGDKGTIKDRVRKSLKYSIVDGAAWSAMMGITLDYIVPFALALKATTAQIGLLASLPYLAMSTSQLKAPELVEKAGSRKRFILPVVFMHALLFLPLILLPYWFEGNQVWLLIGLATLSNVLNTLANPAWGSLMADLVPESMRGRYFGLRGRVSGVVNLAFFFVGGLILQFSHSNIMLGFSIIFACAMAFRFISWYFLSRMHEPAWKISPVKQDNLLLMIKNGFNSNLGRFIAFVSLMNLTVYMAAPFFAVYMIRDLHFEYMTYVIVIAASSVANFTFLTFWGKRADMVGNIRILKLTSIIVPLIPLLWILSAYTPYLVVIQVLSGFAWAGFNLTSANFLYDASSPENRTRCIAVFNAVNGLAMCVGALAGGFLASWLPPIFGYSLLTLFLVSGLLRAIVSGTLLKGISEVRSVRRMDTFHLLLTNPRLDARHAETEK